jgi:ubiquinone/menaquinone biosynthesis C-methylase UbiE
LSKTTPRDYLKTIHLPKLLTELGAQDPDLLAKEIHHFTEKEAKKRDKIILGYFGERGIKQIVDTVATKLNSQPKLKQTAKILDVGAGSGFFTARIASKLKKHLSNASFFAMDATPAMLLAIARKKEAITPFFGIAENIAGSIRKAREYATVPDQFDAVFSTLMLHHCTDIDKVFKSFREVLKPAGKAVVIDMYTHSFTEFKDEMGDVHLGFDPEQIRKAAKKAFSKVTVEKLSGICCSSSGRCAELFVATLRV